MSTSVKDLARTEIEQAGDALVELSHRNRDHPELAFEEEQTSGPCAGMLDDAGFTVTTANVSLAMPTIHPTLGLDCLPVVNHQPELAAYGRTPLADRAMLEGAIAMAWTCVDAATGDTVRDRLLARRHQPWRAPGLPLAVLRPYVTYCWRTPTHIDGDDAVESELLAKSGVIPALSRNRDPRSGASQVAWALGKAKGVLGGRTARRLPPRSIPPSQGGTT